MARWKSGKKKMMEWLEDNSGKNLTKNGFKQN